MKFILTPSTCNFTHADKLKFNTEKRKSEHFINEEEAAATGLIGQIPITNIISYMVSFPLNHSKKTTPNYRNFWL